MFFVWHFDIDCLFGNDIDTNTDIVYFLDSDDYIVCLFDTDIDTKKSRNGKHKALLNFSIVKYQPHHRGS